MGHPEHAADALDGTGGDTEDGDFGNEQDDDAMMAYFDAVSQADVSCQTRSLR